MATRRSSFGITARVLITGEAVLILGDSYFAGNGPGAFTRCQIGLMRFARQHLPSRGHTLTERGSPSRTNGVSRLAEKGSGGLADEDLRRDNGRKC